MTHRRPRQNLLTRPAVLAAVAAVALFGLLYAVGGTAAAPAASAADDPARAQAIADAQANVVRYQAALADPNLSSAGRVEAALQLDINEAALRQLLPPTSTTTSTTTTTVPPPTTTTTSAPPPTTTASPGPQACPPAPAFPDAACTGVPAGVTLTAYTGPCTITTPNTVIDSKLITCGTLSPRASGIVIRNSRIVGSVYGLSCPSPVPPQPCSTPPFTVVDSEIQAGQVVRNGPEINGLGENNFTAVRVEVTGGNRGVYCRIGCTLRDSWIHGTWIASNSDAHASAVRMSLGATIVHNRLHCSAPDNSAGGGCSADLTGYGDFEPVGNNLIEGNLFVATIGGACAYGGSSGDAPGAGHKEFGPDAHDVRFVDNVFERGSNRRCGAFFPNTDFLHSDGSLPPGNVWSGNVWSDGGVVAPAS